MGRRNRSKKSAKSRPRYRYKDAKRLLFRNSKQDDDDSRCSSVGDDVSLNTNSSWSVSQRDGHSYSRANDDYSRSSRTNTEASNPRSVRRNRHYRKHDSEGVDDYSCSSGECSDGYYSDGYSDYESVSREDESTRSTSDESPFFYSDNESVSRKDEVSDERTRSTNEQDEISDEITRSTHELLKKRPAIFDRTETYLQEIEDEDIVGRRRVHELVPFSWPDKKDRSSGLGVTLRKVRKIIMGVKADGKAPIEYAYLSQTESKIKSVVAEPSVVGTVDELNDENRKEDEKPNKSASPSAAPSVDVPFFVGLETQPLNLEENTREDQAKPLVEQATGMSDYDRLKSIYASLNREKIKMLPLDPITVKKKKAPPRIVVTPRDVAPKPETVVKQDNETSFIAEQCRSPRSTIDGEFEIAKQLYSSGIIKGRLLKKKVRPEDKAEKPPLVKTTPIASRHDVDGSVNEEAADMPSSPPARKADEEIDFEAIKNLYSTGSPVKTRTLEKAIKNGSSKQPKRPDTHSKSESVAPLGVRHAISKGTDRLPSFSESPFVDVSRTKRSESGIDPPRRFVVQTDGKMTWDDFEKARKLHVESNVMRPIEFVPLGSTTMDSSSVIQPKLSGFESVKRVSAVESIDCSIPPAKSFTEAKDSGIRETEEKKTLSIDHVDISVNAKPSCSDVDFESVKHLYAAGSKKTFEIAPPESQHVPVTNQSDMNNTEKQKITHAVNSSMSSTKLESVAQSKRANKPAVSVHMAKQAVKSGPEAPKDQSDIPSVINTSLPEIDFESVKRLYAKQAKKPTAVVSPLSQEAHEIKEASTSEVKGPIDQTSPTSIPRVDFESVKKLYAEQAKKPTAAVSPLSQEAHQTKEASTAAEVEGPINQTSHPAVVNTSIPSVDFEIVKRLYTEQASKNHDVALPTTASHPPIEIDYKPVDIVEGTEESPTITKQTSISDDVVTSTVPDVDFDVIKRLYAGDGLDEIRDDAQPEDKKRRKGRSRKKKKKLYPDMAMDWAFDDTFHSKRSSRRTRRHKSKSKDGDDFPIHEIRTTSPMKVRSSERRGSKVIPADYSDQESRDPSPLSTRPGRQSNLRDKSSSPRRLSRSSSSKSRSKKQKSKSKRAHAIEPISIHVVTPQEGEESFF